jgi:hypothetical protein
MIITAILTSLFCGGLYYAADYDEDGTGKIYGQILWPFKYYLTYWLDEYWAKPFIGCLRCMGSFWGTLFYCNNYWTEYSVIDHIIFIFVVSALNGLYGRIIEG